MFLFNKYESELSNDEKLLMREYEFDKTSPKWKPILYNGTLSNYDVSNVGEVRNKNGSLISPYIPPSGYKTIIIPIYGFDKRKHLMIHRLVAEAFVSNPSNKNEVNHINGNKTCNWYLNLEWVTHQENMSHAISNKLKDHIGVNHPQNKYTENEITIICKLLEDRHIALIDIANIVKVNKNLVVDINNYRSWTHISKKYNLKQHRVQKDYYSIDQLKEICCLLNKDIVFEDISKKLNIPINTIEGISYGMRIGTMDSHNGIINKVNPNRTLVRGDDLICAIHKAFKLLENPTLSSRAIANETNLSTGMVNALYEGHLYSDIRSLYNLPDQREVPTNFPSEITQFIINAAKNGMSNNDILDIVSTKYELKDRNKTLQYIYYVKYRYVNND